MAVHMEKEKNWSLKKKVNSRWIKDSNVMNKNKKILVKPPTPQILVESIGECETLGSKKDA